MIGEAPGPEEDKQGMPFCNNAGAGREINEHYLPLSGYRRPQIRVNNAIRCLPSTPQHKLDLKRQQHRDLVRTCADHHLYPELAANRNRKLIVTLGAFAAYAIDPDIDLEMHHGIPLDTDWGRVFPMWHPAQGLHEPKKVVQIRTDWWRLKQYSQHQLEVPIDRYPHPDYQEIESVQQLDEYLGGESSFHLPLAGDTEFTRTGDPHCLSLSIRPGTGRVIRSENARVLRRLQLYYDRWKGTVLFHNFLFDREVLTRMDLRLEWRQVIDTMMKVFHLGNLPQGLKTLAYRELGMEMMDFDDLVTPHSRELVLQYYGDATLEDWSTPPAQQVRSASGAMRLYRPQGFESKVNRFWTDYAKNKDKDIFDMWTKNWEEHQEEVEAKLGPWPGKCITHAPWAEVIYYACRDADATLRLWPLIEYMESRVGKVTQERYREGYAA